MFEIEQIVWDRSVYRPVRIENVYIDGNYDVITLGEKHTHSARQENLSFIKVNKTNRQDSRKAIQARLPFTNSTGSMQAYKGFPGAGGWNRGKLPAEYTLPKGVQYIVFSYDTPIYWIDLDGNATRPVARYSQTTSCHQGMCY